jgi:periplasmic protein TonB
MPFDPTTLVADERPALLRWSISTAIVLSAHALIAVALVARPDYVDLATGSPIVMIELAPLPIGPVDPPRDLAPGLQQLQNESEERAKIERQADPEPQKLDPLPEQPVDADAMVTLPVPKPDPPKEPEPDKAAQQASLEVPVPTAPPTATTSDPQPAGPAIGQVPDSTAAAIATWQQLLQAQLERSKRYPRRARGAHGKVTVAFTVGRNGGVVSSHIVQGSGSAILDEEALALIKRAQPLPPPPSTIADNQLSLVVPINYIASRQ